MATLEEIRYIANAEVPDKLSYFMGESYFMVEGISPVFWVVTIAILAGIIIKLTIQSRKHFRNLNQNIDFMERFSRSVNGIEIEKVFHDICISAKGEYMAMYTRREGWYGLIFEINIAENEKHVSIPLLIKTHEASSKEEKSGNFFVTTFFENNKSNMIQIYTREKPISVNTDAYRQMQVLCENGVRLHTLLSSELLSERQSRVAEIATKLSSSFLSWQYDRDRFFFFISHIIIKSIRAVEVVIRDEKNNHDYYYGDKGSIGISKEFFIHHSGCKMRVVTVSPLDSKQINIIGEFIDSSYSLFVHEEDNLKRAEEFLQFLIHSNEAMELEFPYFSHHSDLVGIVTLCIAKSLQLDSRTIKSLEIAAKIHDIGMIADVSFSLGKEEKLTVSEMDVIRNHPLYGSIIVEPLNQIYEIGDLIKFHHERYDGQGYPFGLIGDETPVPAQILGFAEHFVGLISDRSYRPGKALVKAAEEVKKMAGQAFHPIIIRAFEQEEQKIFNQLLALSPNLKY